jgi:hypothetical protein
VQDLRRSTGEKSVAITKLFDCLPFFIRTREKKVVKQHFQRCVEGKNTGDVTMHRY